MYLLKDKLFLLFIIFFIFPINLIGQVNLFHTSDQYYNNLVLINPSYSGYDDALSVNISYKNQWVGFNGSPQSAIIAIHTPIQSRNIGVGFQVQKHNYGIQQNLVFNGDYAYNINLSKSKLALGLGFNIAQHEISWSELVAYEIDDNSLLPYNINGYSLNFRVGANYKIRQFTTGLSMLNLLSNNWNDDVSNQNNYNEGIHLFYSIAYNFNINTQFDFIPFLLLRYNQLNGIYLDITTHFFYHKMVGAGITYRTEGNLIGLLQFQINKQSRIAYSYGFDIDGNNSLGGTHEIILKYIFQYERKVENLR